MLTRITGFSASFVFLLLVILGIQAEVAKSMEGNADAKVRPAWRMIVIVRWQHSMCLIHCMSHDLRLSGSESIIM